MKWKVFTEREGDRGRDRGRRVRGRERRKEIVTKGLWS